MSIVSGLLQPGARVLSVGATTVFGLVLGHLPAQLRPNLVVTNCQVQPTTVDPGQSINVTADVCNQGAWGTAQLWADAIYLNTQSVLNGNEQQIGGPYCQNFFNFILPGQCYSTFSAVVTRTVTIPNVAPGTYYVGYRANITNSQIGACTPSPWIIGESSYADNICWTKITVGQPTCEFVAQASGCTNVTLTGADRLVGGVHTITLTAIGFTPGDILVWFGGTPGAFTLPTTPCLLLVAPVASFASMPAGLTDQWTFSAVVPPGGITVAFQVIRVPSMQSLLDPSNGLLMTCP